MNVNKHLGPINAMNGHGFINRTDTCENMFVHQTAIIQNVPQKIMQSVGRGEAVEFEIVSHAAESSTAYRAPSRDSIEHDSRRNRKRLHRCSCGRHVQQHYDRSRRFQEV